MTEFMKWFCLFISFILVVRTMSLRSLFSGSTQIYAWYWAVGASLVLLCALLSTELASATSEGWTSGMQYFAAILLVTPAVSALGARRPGVRVWQAFVVIPLILVLQWPATSQLLSSHGRETLQLENPATVGILFVLLMTAGVGLGTSLTLPYLLCFASVLCCLMPWTGWFAGTANLPFAAPLLLLAAESLARSTIKRRCRSISRAATVTERIDETWSLFQDLYGLIWARRVLDRVNQFSGREHWTVELTMSGFRRPDGRLAADEDLKKPMEAFCWVLGRFVDEIWLKRHLGDLCMLPRR